MPETDATESDTHQARTPTEARGAIKTGRVRYILLISFVLAAAGLSAVAFVFSQVG